MQPGQAAAIVALLESTSIKQAAEVSKVPLRTLHGWIADDTEFQTELRQAESTVLAQSVRRLAALTEKATQAIEEGLDSENVVVKLKSAELVLSKLLALRESIDLESRIAALEGAINANK